MQIFIHRDGSDFGPYESEDIRSFLATGRFSANDLGWMDGMKEWEPLRNFADLRESVAVPAKHQVGGYAGATLAANETVLLKTTLHPVIFANGLAKGLAFGMILWLVIFFTASQNPVAWHSVGRWIALAFLITPVIIRPYRM